MGKCFFGGQKSFVKKTFKPLKKTVITDPLLRAQAGKHSGSYDGLYSKQGMNLSLNRFAL